MSYPWFRFYSETPYDKKLDLIAEETELEFLTILGAWSLLLSLANESAIRGSLYVTTKKRYSNNYISKLMRLSLETTKKILDCFVEYGLIDTDQDGAIYICNWDKRQFSSDSSSERVAKYRKKKKEEEEKCNDCETLHVTLPSASASVNINSLSTNYLRIFSQVTGMAGIPGNKPEAFEAIDNLLSVHKTEELTIEYLKPFWNNWNNLKTKNGKPYSKTNLAWLTEYALAGQMPGTQSSDSKYTGARVYDE